MNHIPFRNTLVPALAAVLFCPLSLGAEPLTEKDTAELKVLAESFIADLESGEIRRFHEYFEPASLGKLMNEQRRLVLEIVEAHPDDYGKMLVLKPDRKTALREQDPMKFFAGIEFTSQMKGFAKLAGRKLEIVGVTGSREKAYLVMDGHLDGFAGKSKSHLSAWTAISTPAGWRLDASPLVRSQRGKTLANDFPDGKGR